MARIIELRDGDCRVAVSTAGGAILNAEVRGISILQPTDSPGLATRLHGREACFPLVPFGGRVEGNAFWFGDREYLLAPNTPDPLALHGDGWLREWTVVNATSRSASLILECDAGNHSPYAYRAEQRIEVLPMGLRLTLEVLNLGRETLPFGLGFHPYLPVTPDCSVQFEADAFWSEREMHLSGKRQDLSTDFDFRLPRPVPGIWINNCYEEWSGKALLSYAAGHAITLSADPVFPWLMVHKPEGASAYLCLEPMSHRPNGQGNPGDAGLAPLKPGVSLSGSMVVELTGWHSA